MAEKDKGVTVRVEELALSNSVTLLALGVQADSGSNPAGYSPDNPGH